LVEHRTPNPGVAGSSPAWPATDPEAEESKRRSRMANAKEWVDQSVQFFREVWIELKKVHWPSWKETRAATVVVVVVVMVFALFLGLVDFSLSHAIQRLLAPRLS
jgi:preprotein translocase subunit SecE